MVQGVGVFRAYGVCAHVLGGLVAAASLSALLVAMRLCITRTQRRRVLRRLHRGGQRAWLMRQPSSGSPAQDVSSAPRQRSGSVETSQRRADLL